MFRFCFIFFIGIQAASAQMFSAELAPEICLASELKAETIVLSPQNQARLMATSNLEVTYENFPSSAKDAFEAAVSIWEKIIISKVPIRIKASWSSLSGQTLASSGATRIFRNFRGAPFKDVWYIAPLAEAISGTDLNNGDFDINVTLNSNINWSFATAGVPFTGRYDLVTVVMHEIAHGLGFSSSLKMINNDTEGQWGNAGFPYIYDSFIINERSKILISTSNFANPSISLGDQITGDNLSFLLNNVNTTAKLYAPNPYKTGGSLSHFDENTYATGSGNSMMTPTIRVAQITHDPGQLILAVLNQMGWGVNGLEGFIPLASEPQSTVLVYPNPASEKIIVNLPIKLSTGNVSVKLIDMKGNIQIEMAQDHKENSVLELSVNHLIPGVYLLQISDPTFREIRKIMID